MFFFQIPLEQEGPHDAVAPRVGRVHRVRVLLHQLVHAPQLEDEFIAQGHGIGLFEPVSTLRLRYTLSSRWKLVGEASAERSSTDLFYVIERGE